MSEISERQKIILALVIQEYVQQVQPISSKRLVDNYHLEYSSATIRNEMAFLTDVGYLQQPYTSAGRIPTEDGYRYFVSQLMGHTSLPSETRQTIQHQFYQARRDIDQWIRLAASVLARQSHGASLVTSLHSQQARLKRLEVISTHGRQALMVLVLEDGKIHQQLLKLSEPFSQESINAVTAWINKVAYRKDADAISKNIKLVDDDLKKDILKLAVDAMRSIDDVLTGNFYRDGLANVLTEPEFSEPSVAHRTLRFWEERSQLENLLLETVLSPDTSGIHVLIGGEGTWEDLSECAVVLSRYGVPGVASGALGVLGPTRMSYAHTISTVQFVANLLSDLVGDTLSNERYDG
ncbi:MAG: heat-inducible transcriptional repressor HrcA [Chloroflexota bacterium]|nr:heat-inducible transcriptional repressor HrcA [Chloroflexota bacterium]